MEMVKLFQLQLEHYEKVEGDELSLEGKANQLGQMVRNHLPAAMQGLAVVPLFAGYDTRRQTGRLFQYDVTGGRYEESDFATTGSGSLHAGTVKLGCEGMTARTRPSTWPSRPCSTPPTRTPPPAGPTSCAASTRRRHHHRRRLRAGQEDDRGRRRFRALATGSRTPRARATAGGRPTMGAEGGRHEHALLRRARAGDEGPGRLRPQGHRPGPQPGRRSSTTTAS